jgi:hypothetical protein
MVRPRFISKKAGVRTLGSAVDQPRGSTYLAKEEREKVDSVLDRAGMIRQTGLSKRVRDITGRSSAKEEDERLEATKAAMVRLSKLRIKERKEKNNG